MPDQQYCHLIFPVKKLSGTRKDVAWEDIPLRSPFYHIRDKQISSMQLEKFISVRKKFIAS